MEKESKKPELNPQINDILRKAFNEFAEKYDQMLITPLLQAFIPLAITTQAYQKKRILEVACGSGLHSLYFAKTMLQKGSVMVCTDISDQMMKIVKRTFDNPNEDYGKIEGNKYYITDNEVQSGFDIEEEIKKNGIKDSDRFVLGCRANNESLPFKDNSFDCYIANLSLMHVDNYKNQLSEALRVCQPGSPLVFSVWGRRENVQVFDVLEQIFAKHGHKKAGSKSDHFYLGQNPLKLKEEMTLLGYSNIKMWYQTINFPFKNADEYSEMVLSMPENKRILNRLKSIEGQIKQEIYQQFKEKIDEVFEPKHFEILIILAYKPETKK